jgi:predicted ATP-dependent serine protease
MATLSATSPPALIVIDSVQTLWSEGIEAAPGTLSQMRLAARAHRHRFRAVGADPNRLSKLLAVLEARCGVRLAGHDVYLNVAGALSSASPPRTLLPPLCCSPP